MRGDEADSREIQGFICTARHRKGANSIFDA